MVVKKPCSDSSEKLKHSVEVSDSSLLHVHSECTLEALGKCLLDAWICRQQFFYVTFLKWGTL